MRNNEQELIGQLWVNKGKESGRMYLRGHVNGVKIVAFYNEGKGGDGPGEGAFFSVVADTRSEDESKKDGFKKKPFNKPSNKSYGSKPKFVSKSRPSTDSDEAPF